MTLDPLTGPINLIGQKRMNVRPIELRAATRSPQLPSDGAAYSWGALDVGDCTWALPSESEFRFRRRGGRPGLLRQLQSQMRRLPHLRRTHLRFTVAIAITMVANMCICFSCRLAIKQCSGFCGDTVSRGGAWHSRARYQPGKPECRRRIARTRLGFQQDTALSAEG